MKLIFIHITFLLISLNINAETPQELIKAQKEKIEYLEKKVLDLEAQIEFQSNNFTRRDTDETYYDTTVICDHDYCNEL